MPLQQVASDPEWQPPSLERGPVARCQICRGRIHWAYQARPAPREGSQHTICFLAEAILEKVQEFAASDLPQVGYLFLESLLKWVSSFVQLFFPIAYFCRDKLGEKVGLCTI